jgi:predicted HAD superfamily Cof-like phosphohydrolase
MQDVIEDVFDEIQRSNMSKLGADGLPIFRADGKVLKGPSYFKPNFTKVLEKAVG